MIRVYAGDNYASALDPSEFRREIRHTSGDESTLLRDILDDSQAYVETVTGLRFLRRSVTEERYPGLRDGAMRFSVRPAATVTSLSYRSFDGGEWTNLDESHWIADDRRLEIHSLSDGPYQGIYLGLPVSHLGSRWRVEYVAGIAATKAEGLADARWRVLRQAALRMAAWRYANPDSSMDGCMKEVERLLSPVMPEDLIG